MKKLSIILSLFIIIVSCKGNENKDKTDKKSAKKENQLKRYDIKSGMIAYKTTISGEVMGSVITGSGTENLYFKNWGAVELREEQSTQTTNTNIFGQKNSETTESHVMYKLDNGDSYQVDFDKKEIVMQKDLAMELTKTFQKNADAGEAGKSMLESMGGKKIGEEKFLGYDCEIWDLMGAKQWIHKDIMLKLEMNMMGIKTLKEATSVKFKVNVPDKNFKLPDYPIKKEESMLNSEDFEESMEDMNANMDKLSKMSFEEWKKMAMADDTDNEMEGMSEEELRKTYDMMQQMIKARQGN